MVGNIHKKSQFWHDVLDASKFVLDVIDQSYRLPFPEACPPFYVRNNASRRNHLLFTEEAIQSLMRRNCIKGVVATGKKLRLVLDLRPENGYLKKFTFRYENLKTLAKMFGKLFYFATFDLKNRYHHVLIHKDNVGFSWEFQGKHRFFVFFGNAVRIGPGFLCVHQDVEAAGQKMERVGDPQHHIHR